MFPKLLIDHSKLVISEVFHIYMDKGGKFNPQICPYDSQILFNAFLLYINCHGKPGLLIPAGYADEREVSRKPKEILGAKPTRCRLGDRLSCRAGNAPGGI